ncbi:MAG: hypothetical protein SVR81_09990 [Chloroflexota bacterium]|nr:hypothetical protein [Chloroflexota bacterium]
MRGYKNGSDTNAYIAFLYRCNLGGYIFCGDKTKKLSKKILFSILIPVIFFVGPVLDQIIGKVYFDHLCESDRGLFVYEKVSLDSSEFDGNNNLIYYQSLNNFFKFDYKKKYKTGIDIDKKYIFLGIEKNSVYLKNTENNKIISEYVNFSFVGGVLSRWLSNSISGGSISCDRIDQKDMDKLISLSFVKE